MQITITILEMPTTIPTGNEFLASEYPSSGVYQSPTNVYFVDKGTTIVEWCSRSLIMLASCIEVPASQTGCSINDLLKAIAISQKPELVKDLLNV